MNEVWVIDALRTPIGRLAGTLSGVRPDDLAALAIRGVLERTGVPDDAVDDVYVGCANQAGEDNRNVARMAVLLAGLPETVPGVTVNRLCASGLEAVVQASRAIRCGEETLCVAGGVESMSRAPYSLPKAATPFSPGNLTAYDTSLGWRYPNPKMAQRFPLESMGETAENLAERYGIPRQEQDEFALASHLKAVAAQDAGRFKDELLPVPVRDGTVDADQGPRRDTSLEKLARLRAVFRQGGTVTAGNSSPLNDGSAAVVLCSPEAARERGLRPKARILSAAAAGVDPRYMGIGPVPASRKALALAGLTLADMGVIELNEAFAAQSLAVLREWGIAADDPRLNPNGGAIAIGHPLGCSGARLVATLLPEMERRQARYGLATLCIGVGQGLAAVFERLDGRAA